MTQTDDPALPEPEVLPARRSLWKRLSLVWLVPLGALLVSLWVVFTAYNDRGPLIEIAFPNASGVKVDETDLRYRDVTVGVVESLRFSPALAEVLIGVRLDKDVAPYVDEDAQFWVVRPEVTAQGVSGLDTVLSGVYISGAWNRTIDAPATRFVGLDKAPLVPPGQEGLSISLKSENVEGLSEGTPILFRGISVGQVANLRLSEDGLSVIADAFIRSPESRLITTATRFWDTSGFSFSFGAQGAQLDVSSLASLVTGGVAFDTIVSGGTAVPDGEQFQLFVDEETARNSVFTGADAGPTLDLAVIFEGSVSGLAAGAAVEFQGINVGSVTAITGLVDEDRFGDRNVRLLATLSLRLAKLGLPADATAADALDFVDEAVQLGLRAQLQNASILTGGLKVALLVPDAIGPQLPARIDRDGQPYPLLPSVAANLSDFSDTAEGVFNRINELPVEELLSSAINVMDSVNRLLNDEGTTSTPAEVLALIEDMRALVRSEPVQALPDQAAEVMAGLTESIAAFETLLNAVNEAGTADRLVAALQAAEDAANAVSAAVEGVDELVVELQAVARSADTLMATANALPLADLIAQATTILASADSLLNAPATQALPEELRATVAEARGVVSDLRSSGLVEQLGGMVAGTRTAIEDVRAALLPVLASADGALAGVPALVARVEGVAGQADALLATANALPLADLVARANGVIASADAILADPATQALPAQVGAAVDAARGTLDDLRASGVIAGANATLADTRAAIARITEALLPVIASADTALGGVPALVARIEGVAQSADALLATANGLPLDDLLAQANAVIASADAILADPATLALPAQVGAAVDAARGTLEDLRASGVIATADATLAETRAAVTRITEALLPVLDSAQSAAVSLDSAAADLPRLTARAETIAADIEKLVAQAAEVPLDQLAARAMVLIDSANLLISSADTQAVPAALTAALAQIEGVLADMRAGGLIENANATLVSTGRAAEAIATASGELPGLVARMNRLLAQVETVIGGYDADGALGSEAKAALREVRDAAKSLNSLARTIERNPNSLLFGR